MSLYYTNVFSRGETLYIREIGGILKKEKVQTSLFVPSKESSKYSDIFGNPLKEIPFDSYKKKKEFLQNHSGISNMNIYGDIHPKYEYICKAYPDEIHPDMSDIYAVFLDIETEVEHGSFPDIETTPEEVNAITVSPIGSDKTYTFGTGEFKGEKNTVYVRCENEKDLLGKFIVFWRKQYPDIVSGWYVKFFDMPYLINRCVKVLGESITKKLSPWGMLKESTVEMYGKEQQVYDILGITTLEYIDLYKKFTYSTPENYKLGTVAHEELGEAKLDYSEYSNIHELYKNDFDKFIRYNIKDVTLLKQLEEKLRLVELATILAYGAKVNYEDVFYQVRMWDCIIYNYLFERNVIVPNKQRTEADDRIVGGYVKEPILGFQDFVATFDATALYPSIIRTFNISPDTLVDGVTADTTDVDMFLDRKVDTSRFKEMGLTVCANGQAYNKSQVGFLPTLMEKFFEDRSFYKKKMIEAKKEYESKKPTSTEEQLKEISNKISKFKVLQEAKKVCANSCFGATGNQYFRFFDNRIAEAITKSGQLSTKWIERTLNVYMNSLFKTENIEYVIYSDTDSVMLTLKPLVDKYLSNITDKQKITDVISKFCEEKLVPLINKSYSEMTEMMNCNVNYLNMKREVIADKAVFQGKKRYIMNIYDSEGVRYSEPQLKIQGVEAVRSSTPIICKEKIKECLKIILRGTQSELLEYIQNFKTEFMKTNYVDIAFPRGMNGVEKYTGEYNKAKKGTPIHVRGAIMYNALLESLELTNKYPKIYEGNKIKFIYLKDPNPLKTHVISFIDVIPEEFEITEYIDYNTQFEKTFLSAIQHITDTIGWDCEKKNRLSQFVKR